MKELKTLKRSAFYYAFSILFTGMVNFIAIPVLKQKTGADEYAYLNLYMNFLLVFGYVGAGWLIQGCIRFYPKYSNQPAFRKSFLKMTIGSALVTAFVSMVLVFFSPHYRWMFIAFPLAILVINLQMVAIAWLQATLQPKTVAAAEVLRALIFLLVIILIKPNGFCNVTIAAWTGWVFSYACSLFFLWVMSSRKKLDVELQNQLKPTGQSSYLTELLRFGLPLSLWMAALYGVFFADRFFLLRYTTASTTGHYSALFDVLLKGIGFALSPLVTAVYPIMVRLYQEENLVGLKNMSSKVLRWQILIALLAITSYLIAWPWVKQILGIEVEAKTLFYSGLFILSGASLWQMNMLMQKRLELQHKTNFLLGAILICLMAMLVMDWFFIPNNGFLAAAIIFFCTALLYMSIIIVKHKLTKAYTVTIS